MDKTTVVTDSKLRRETPFFKLDFVDEIDDEGIPSFIPDPNSDDPTTPVEGLLQILPAGLTAAEFIGMIQTVNRNGEITVSQITEVSVYTDPDNYLVIYNGLGGERYYVPANGYFGYQEVLDSVKGKLVKILESNTFRLTQETPTAELGKVSKLPTVGQRFFLRRINQYYGSASDVEGVATKSGDDILLSGIYADADEHTVRIAPDGSATYTSTNYADGHDLVVTLWVYE